MWCIYICIYTNQPANQTESITELSPLGTSCTLKGKHLNLGADEKYGVLHKQVKLAVS